MERDPKAVDPPRAAQRSAPSKPWLLYGSSLLLLGAAFAATHAARPGAFPFTTGCPWGTGPASCAGSAPCVAPAGCGGEAEPSHAPLPDEEPATAPQRPEPAPAAPLAASMPPAPASVDGGGARPMADAPRRVRVGDGSGRTLIARLLSAPEAGMILLPDGQVGWPNRLIYTDEPFRPLSAEAMAEALLSGPFRGFHLKQTPHYVIVYQCSERFAEDSARLLESLYDGLLARFREMHFDVHDAEFPLVAVIFANEDDFRAHRKIAPDVQAYYDPVTNRIHFYEVQRRQVEDPMFAAMRKPQTVAHEGTHQIAQNIGVQPRMADWPAWLVEGLAELAAATETNRGAWAGFSRVNPLHIATLEDLEDTDALQGRGAGAQRVRVGHDPRRSMVEYIVTRDTLTPTDYALAWALTHYLANRQTEKFVAYLKEMGRREAGAERSKAADLDLFRAHFGKDPAAIDTKVAGHLNRLRSQSPLMYYAVLFEQPLPGNLVRRGTLVSRSPQLIREWIEERMPDPQGGPYQWRAFPFRNRKEAFFFTEQWLNSQ
jgi:hypothetical protein